MGRQIARTTQWPEIARRLALGQRGVDIAQALSMNPNVLSSTINHPMFRSVYEKAQEVRNDKVFDVQGYFTTKVEQACKVISDTMEFGSDEKSRIAAAKEVIRMSLGRLQSPGRPMISVVNNDNRKLTFEDKLALTDFSSLDDEDDDLGALTDVTPSEDELSAQLPSSVDALMSYNIKKGV